MAAAPDTRAKPGAAPGSRWTRRRTRLALAALALGILLRTALPEGLRIGIARAASDALGRRVEVADVDLGLFAGRASVEGLAIGGADLAAPLDPEALWLRCASAGVRIAWLPLWTGRIRIREIALVEPMLRLERTADGTLAPFVLAPAAPPTEEPALPAEEAAESAGGLDLVIESVSLDRGELKLVRQRDAASIALLRFENLSLRDLSHQQGVTGVGAVALHGPQLQVHADALLEDAEATEAAAAPPPSESAPAPTQSEGAGSGDRISDLDIEAARFAWRLPDGEEIEVEFELHARDAGASGAPFPLEIKLATDRATLALEGQLGLAPLRFDGKLRWVGVRLPRLARAVPDLPVEVSSGQSDMELEVSLRTPPGAPETPAGVRLQGRARIADLAIASPDGAFSVAWKELALELASLTLPLGDTPGSGLTVQLAKVALNGPQIEVTRSAAAPGEPAAATAEQPAEAATETLPAETSAPAHVAMDVLEVNGGSLRFRDQVIRPPVDTKLRDLRIRARGVRWPERDLASLRLTAKGPQGAALELKGAFAKGVGNLDLDLRQLPLTAFDPYAGDATGLKIDAGRASLAAKLGLRKDGVAAKSKLSLHQLSLTERESGWFQKAFGVPLDVALALLRDLQGDITMPIDVEQGADGTRIGMAAAVASALRQALMGALASPLKLLGGVAGAAGDALSSGLAPIPMQPGRSELASSAHERVARLAQLLASRPGLQVSLRGSAGAQDDSELARREVVARAKADEPLPGQDELGFFERRRVRAALADADVEDLDALDAETASALARLTASLQVSEESRQALALARAQAVARALQEEHGAPAEAVAAVEAESGPAQVALELRSR